MFHVKHLYILKFKFLNPVILQGARVRTIALIYQKLKTIEKIYDEFYQNIKLSTSYPHCNSLTINKLKSYPQVINNIKEEKVSKTDLLNNKTKTNELTYVLYSLTMFMSQI